MSELRHLLERAAPTPRPLDVDEIRGRVDRRRRRQRVAVLAAVVIVAVGAGVVSTLLPDDEEQGLETFADESTTTSTTAVPPAAGPGAAVADVLATGRAVTVADGTVWAVAVENDGTFVGLLHPASGEVADSVEVDRRVREVEVAGGVVWAYGGGDGGEPDGGVVAIDASTTDVLGTFGFADGFSPYDLAAMSDGTAWVADATGDRVLHLDPADLSEEVDEVPVTGQPTDLVLTDDGLLWVRSSMTGTIVSIDPSAASVVSTEPWDAPLFAAFRDGTLWSTDGSRLVEVHPETLDVGLSASLGARLAISDVRAVWSEPGGLWVATATGVSAFAPDDLDAPVETIHTRWEVADVAVTASQVWYVDAGGLHRWDRAVPTGD